MSEILQKRKGVSGVRGGSRPGSGSSSGSTGSTLGGPGTSRSSLGGSGGTGRSPITSNSWGSSTSTLGKADYFSRGGGSPFTIGGSSAFAGRQAGGGTRDQVFGTRRFGSGYPYSNGNIQRGGVFGQPFPFGFWPIFFVGHGYSGQYRGGRVNGTEQRPGGDLVQVAVYPNSTQWVMTPEQMANNSALETFYMIGDRESVETMLLILNPCVGCEQYSCGTVNGSVTTFTGNDTTPPRFENTLQWYRASSFGLAYAGYNNTYAFPPLNESTTLDWDSSTPLPDALSGDTFLDCLNTTIAAALPVLNAGSGRFIQGRLSWMVIWAIWSAVTLMLLGDFKL